MLRPKNVVADANIEKVADLICSQEDNPGTIKSTRQIAKELNINRISVQRITKCEIGLTAFRRVTASTGDF